MSTITPDVTVSEITVLLQHWDQQDPAAKERLLTLILPQLRRIAESRLRRERADHTLQPTALVNELYIYLACRTQMTYTSRAHFLAVASEAMRRILVDHARSRNAQKRGGLTPEGRRRLSLAMKKRWAERKKKTS